HAGRRGGCPPGLRDAGGGRLRAARDARHRRAPRPRRDARPAARDRVTEVTDGPTDPAGSLVWARRKTPPNCRIPRMREESPSYARAVTDALPDRPTSHVLGRLVDAIGLHVFIGEIVDGVYREVFTGPGTESLMGGSVPDGVHLDDAWPQRIHPDDYGT